jgi:predicted nucleic acid-binding protein
VVDASVWVARLVPQDLHHAASRVWLERYITGGGLVAGPMLLIAEVGGAISRRTGDPALAHSAVAHLLRLPALRLVAIDRRLGQVATQLASDLGLRGADAMYVATALELRVPLLTLDQDQLSRVATSISASTP